MGITKEQFRESVLQIKEFILSKTEEIKTKVPLTRTINGKPLSEDITLNSSDVGADASGTAEQTVSSHNTATDAHNDLRLLIEGLTERLNAFANSTDEDLDQAAEFVAYIKANRELIESVTTAKVSVSDIIDNLTTNVSNVPLSAAQGVVLKDSINTLQALVETLQESVNSGVNIDASNKLDKNNPTGTGSLSLNRLANSSVGQKSVALGNSTTASGEDSYAEGRLSKAVTRQAHAEGDCTVAGDVDINTSDASQISAYPAGSAAHAEGIYTNAKGRAAHAEGYLTKATGNAAHAEGESTLAQGNNSHAEGGGTQATGNYSHAEGANSAGNIKTTASGVASHAEGKGTTASGEAAHAEGYETRASEPGAHAEGFGTEATGLYSHAEGYQTKAMNGNSHTEGFKTVAAGLRSHAEGNNSQTGADATAAHAEGWGSQALGVGSHSEGLETIAEGNYSHTEGTDNRAIGNNSHAEGYVTIAKGKGSHTEGKQNIAYGDYSHVEGIGNNYIKTNTIPGIQWQSCSPSTGIEKSNLISNGIFSTETFTYDGVTYNYGIYVPKNYFYQWTTMPESHNGFWKGSLEFRVYTQEYPNESNLFTEVLITDRDYHDWATPTSTICIYYNSEEIYNKHGNGMLNSSVYYDCKLTVNSVDIGAGEDTEEPIQIGPIHVQGQYADLDKDYAHVVGGGTSETDRKNIHTIDWAGNAFFAGDIKCTDANGNVISLQ